MPEPRALVILDNPITATELVGELMDQGFRVDVVDSGLAAIRQVWQEAYDEVMIDRGLRGMTAGELAFHVGNLAPRVRVTMLDRRRAA